MATYKIEFSTRLDDAVTFVRERANAAISVPNGEALEDQPGYLATNEAYLQYVLNIAAEDYAKMQKEAKKAKEAEWGQALSRRQVFKGLEQVGMLDGIKAFVAAQSAEVQKEWDSADRFFRGSPMINQMWAAMPSNAGKTQEELDAGLDALFASFAELDV